MNATKDTLHGVCGREGGLPTGNLQVQGDTVPSESTQGALCVPVLH